MSRLVFSFSQRFDVNILIGQNADRNVDVAVRINHYDITDMVTAHELGGFQNG